MAAEVKASLFKRNGEMKIVKEDIVKESSNDKTNLDALIGSLVKVQKQVNEALTEIVEAERSTTNNKTTKSKEMDVDNEDGSDDEDDDDDEDDEDDGNNNSLNAGLDVNNSHQPVPKKPKT